MADDRVPWVSAADAARLLGVSRSTLYAYVSRRLVRSQPSSTSTRDRMYAREDLERLRRRTEERRAPDKAAARALQWGLPILESSITLTDGRRLYYRGLDAGMLARSRSLEDVAALIWTGTINRPPARPSGVRIGVAAARLPFVARSQSILAAAAARDPLAFDRRPASLAAIGMRIVRLLVRAAINRDPGGADVHAAL